jgi:hypothetical protein
VPGNCRTQGLQKGQGKSRQTTEQNFIVFRGNMEKQDLLSKILRQQRSRPGRANLCVELSLARSHPPHVSLQRGPLPLSPDCTLRRLDDTLLCASQRFQEEAVGVKQILGGL